MQADGHLVVYDASWQAQWSSGTAGHPGAWLAVQDDGNLVVYDAYGYPIWTRQWQVNAPCPDCPPSVQALGERTARQGSRQSPPQGRRLRFALAQTICRVDPPDKWRTRRRGSSAPQRR